MSQKYVEVVVRVPTENCCGCPLRGTASWGGSWCQYLDEELPMGNKHKDCPANKIKEIYHCKCGAKLRHNFLKKRSLSVLLQQGVAMIKCNDCGAVFHETDMNRHEQEHGICPFCGGEDLVEAKVS